MMRLGVHGGSISQAPNILDLTFTTAAAMITDPYRRWYRNVNGLGLLHYQVHATMVCLLSKRKFSFFCFSISKLMDMLIIFSS